MTSITSCQSGYYYQNNQCIACPLQCTTDNCCDGCSAHRDTMLSVYEQSLGNCLDISCSEGQQLDVQRRVCVCQIQNCIQCYSQDRCDECRLGYQFNNVAMQCQPKVCANPIAYYNIDEDECIVCGFKCSKCSSTQCTECVDVVEYVQDDKNIVNCKRVCGDNCGECTPDKVCTQCVNSSYIFSATDNTQCIRCQNCSLCDQISRTCSQCIGTNYYVGANQTDCIKCDDTCSECNATQCLQCYPQSGAVAKIDVTYPTKCFTCGIDCIDCNKSNCLQCKTNALYIELIQHKNCIACEQNCVECDQNTGVCLTCKQGAFYLIVTTQGDKRTCGLCNTFCNRCDENTCLQCKSGYYRNPLNMFECIPCEKNCAFCSDTECLTCKTNYYKNMQVIKECRYCGLNCELCDVPNSQCTRCAVGYYISAIQKDECVQCGSNCQRCSSATVCDVCISSKYYQKSGDNSCIPCESNCHTCTTTECTTCVSNQFRRDIQNPLQCIPCHSSCLSCDNIQCLQCKEQYAVNIQSDKQQCRKCIQNCSQCDENVQCIQCNDGYYLSSQQICLKCSDNCSKCTQSECTECAISYYQNSALKTSCLQCGFHCKKCDFLTGECLQCTDSALEFPNPDNKSDCTTCGNNCQICDKTNVSCIQCVPHFYIKSSDLKNCYQCGTDCLDCNESGCTQCPLHYSKDPSNPANCIPCGSNCTQCDFNTNECIMCLPQYYMVTLLKVNCLPCGNNCDVCDANQCLKCKTGLYGRDPTNIQNCITCGTNCNQCRFEDVSCQICQNGYYTETPTGINCSQCGNNCLECDGLKCIKCQTDYPSLDLTNKMNCVKCDPNCKTCNLNDSTCSVCNDGYYQNVNDITKCIKCGLNCDSCNSSSPNCLKCNPLFPNLDQSNKQNCTTLGANCIQSDFSSGVCTLCKDNTYFVDPKNTQQCRQCGSNCLTCNPTDSTCTKCLALNFFNPNNKEDCISCGSNCKSCTINECLQCVDNYYISQNKQDCLHCTLTGCNQCELVNNQLQCTEDGCQKGYFFDTNKNQCSKCDSSCLECTQYQCTQCPNGLLQNTDNIKECIQCGSNCLSCNRIQCKECSNANGYIVDLVSKMNCIKCDSTCDDCTSKTCLTCKNSDKNFIDPKNPLSCITCEDSKCTLCNQKKPSKCQECINGYGVNSSTKKCEFICKVQNCSKCYQLNAQLCDECVQGQTLNKQTRQCAAITDANRNSFTATNRILTDGYEIKIQFSKELTGQENLQQSSTQSLVQFQLQNTQSGYTYQLLSANKSTFIFKITPNANVKNSQLNIQFVNQKFMSDNSIDNHSTTIDLQAYVTIPQSQREASQNVQAVGDKVSQAASSSIIPLSMIGNFYIITNTIDYTGFLYFLLFTKIRFPQNVLSFYSIFENFQFPFIPNVFLNIIDSDYVQVSPKPFMDRSTDTYFLKNAGQSITIMVGVTSVYIILKLLSFIPMKYVQPYLKKSLSNTWEYSAFFDMFWTVYIYILIGSYLQFYNFDTTDSESFVLNYILFTLFNIQSFGLPFFLTYFMHRQADIGSDKIFQKKFNTILGGLNIQPLQNKYEVNDQEQNNQEKQSDNEKGKTFTQPNNDQQNQVTPRQNFPFTESGEIFLNGNASDNKKDAQRNSEERYKLISIKYSKFYYPVLYFRKSLFGMFIVYLCDYPIIQLVLVSGLSIGVSVYLWYIQPFASRCENMKAIVWEYLMVSVYITSGFLVEDREDEKEEDRFLIGWVIIGFTSILLGVNTALIIYDLLKSIIKPLYQFTQNLFKQKVVKPKQKIISTSTNLITEKPEANIMTTQNPTDRKQSPRKQVLPTTLQTNQVETNKLFKRIRIPSQISQGEKHDIVSENFSFSMDNVPSSQKQIRAFENKPNNPSHNEIVSHHIPSHSEIPLNQNADIASQNYVISQKTQISSTYNNMCDHNQSILIQNQN